MTVSPTMPGRIRALALLSAVLFPLFLLPPASAQVQDWKQIKNPPLHEFHPQQPRRVELPNGMVVFLQEDHELPLIGGSARIRGGSREEPAAKIGMVSIYGEAWRTGGSTVRTGDQLDDFLEARAAKIETGSGVDSTSISWSCLKGDFDDVFKAFLELMRQPAFRQDKIDLAKDQMNTDIARRNDDINQIAGREAARLAYGPDNPYARIPQYATVGAVVRQDLLEWHKKYLQPNNIILGVVGDFDSGTIEARLRQAFESWPKGQPAVPSQITFSAPNPGLYLIPKEEVNQSAIRMVDLGITRNNPDYFAVEVMNEVLGGGFTSRLVTNIRTRKGLAYSVGGGVGAAFDHPGMFRVSMGTKSQTTAESIQALYEELDNIVKNPATEEELKRAKESILNSFIFNFDSKEKVLQERMRYEFYGYPADFLERYRAGIEKTTTQDVARVAQKYVHRGKLAVLVVGNDKEFDKQFAALGPATPIDITIPSPAGEKKREAGASASNPEGRALVGKVVQALGGQAKVQSVKSIRQKATTLRKTPQGDIPIEAERVVVFPDRTFIRMKAPQGEMTMTVSPAAAFVGMPGTGAQDLPASRKEETLKGLKRDLLYVAQHAGDPKFTFAAAGSEKIGDVDAKILDISGEGAETRWYVDPQSGHVLRAIYSAMGMNGPAQQSAEYSDWKTTDGLTLPMKAKLFENGKDSGLTEVQELQVNPAIDPKMFEKPAQPPPAKGPGD